MNTHALKNGGERKKHCCHIIMLKLYLCRDEDAAVIAIGESEENGASFSQEYSDVLQNSSPKLPNSELLSN